MEHMRPRIWCMNGTHPAVPAPNYFRYIDVCRYADEPDTMFGEGFGTISAELFSTMRNIPGLEFVATQFQTLAAAFPRRKLDNEMVWYDCPDCGVSSIDPFVAIAIPSLAGCYVGGVGHEVAKA